MKKYLMMILAVATLAFTACDPNKPGKDAVTFQITVSDLTATTATVTVVPSDANVFYYFDICTEKYFNDSLKGDDKALAADIIEYFDDELLQVLSKGETNNSYDFTGLTPGTKYIAYAFRVNAEAGELVGKVQKVDFTTTEIAQVSLSFQVTSNDTAFFFTPSSNEIEYLATMIQTDTLTAHNFTPETYWEEYGLGYYKQMVYIYTMYGYSVDLSYFAMSGGFYIPFDSIDNQSYTFMAQACTEGVMNSDLFVTTFQKPAASAAPLKRSVALLKNEMIAVQKEAKLFTKPSSVNVEKIRK